RPDVFARVGLCAGARHHGAADKLPGLIAGIAPLLCERRSRVWYMGVNKLGTDALLFVVFQVLFKQTVGVVGEPEPADALLFVGQAIQVQAVAILIAGC